jgi:hypothetical protein
MWGLAPAQAKPKHEQQRLLSVTVREKGLAWRTPPPPPAFGCRRLGFRWLVLGHADRRELARRLDPGVHADAVAGHVAAGADVAGAAVLHHDHDLIVDRPGQGRIDVWLGAGLDQPLPREAWRVDADADIAVGTSPPGRVVGGVRIRHPAARRCAERQDHQGRYSHSTHEPASAIPSRRRFHVSVIITSP